MENPTTGSTNPDQHFLGEDANTPTGQAWRAVQNGDVKTLDSVLSTYGKDALGTAKGLIGHHVTALTAAARNGDSASIERLLKHGADPNVAASGHIIFSPIAWAIKSQNLTAVRLLLNADAKPYTAADGADTEDLYDLAVISGDPISKPGNAILELLLETRKPAPTDLADTLHRAVERHAAQWVGMLADFHAEPNHVCKRTGTRAMAAALAIGHIEPNPMRWDSYDRDKIGPRVLRALLKAGADPNLSVRAFHYNPEWNAATFDIDIPRPLVAAIESGAAWAVPMLIQAGADVEPALAHFKRYGFQREHSGRGLALLALVTSESADTTPGGA